MRNAITDPMCALPLIFALIVLAILCTFAIRPTLMDSFSAANEPSFSEAMRGESNGEIGRGFELDTERRDI